MPSHPREQARGWRAQPLLIPISAVSAAVSTTTTAKISLNHGLCFIDSQSSPVELRAIKRRNCLVGTLFLSHHHKAKPLGSTCIAIRDDTYRLDNTARLKHTGDIAFCRLKRQISNK